MGTAWGPYPDTILLFPEAGTEIDLRLPVTSAARQALQQQGLGGHFAVVTAHNPNGHTLEESANRRLSAVLTALVKDRFPDARRADGRSPDGRHTEPGWALSVPLETARVLAAQFFQTAIFWFDGDHFHIVPVLVAGPPLPLPARPERSR